MGLNELYSFVWTLRPTFLWAFPRSAFTKAVLGTDITAFTALRNRWNASGASIISHACDFILLSCHSKVNCEISHRRHVFVHSIADHAGARRDGHRRPSTEYQRAIGAGRDLGVFIAKGDAGCADGPMDVVDLQ